MIIPNLRPCRLLLQSSCFIAVVLLLVVRFPGDAVAAQKSHGKPYALIAGTVWGPDDLPVYGITVKIRRAKDKKPKWEVYSDHQGEFAQRLPAGEADYIIWADLKGFKPADGQPVHLVKEVTVHVYNDERQDIGLHLAH